MMIATLNQLWAEIKAAPTSSGSAALKHQGVCQLHRCESLWGLRGHGRDVPIVTVSGPMGLFVYLIRRLLKYWQGLLNLVQTFAGQLVGNGNCGGRRGTNQCLWVTRSELNPVLSKINTLMCSLCFTYFTRLFKGRVVLDCSRQRCHRLTVLNDAKGAVDEQ
jgi:hypothetical protein